jgi:cobalt-zinc-cadmium efflux system protein
MRLMHDHDHRAADRRLLALSFALIVLFMVGEVAVGLVAGSLALLADAGHMLTDAAALGLAVFASWAASLPARGQWTFGFGRAEILAAQVNGITLVLVTLWVLAEAVRRLLEPPDVRGGLVLALALAGIVVNATVLAVLARARRESLNVRGAYVHLATDLAAFVGTAVAGTLVLATGWNRFDPLASLAVAGLMLVSSYRLLRESTAIFMETSGDIDPAEVERALAAEADVVGVHDLHVWTVTSGFPAVSAHVLVAHGADCHAARARLEQLLAQRFGLAHSTLQVEHAPLGSLPRRRLPLVRR